MKIRIFFMLLLIAIKVDGQLNGDLNSLLSEANAVYKIPKGYQLADPLNYPPFFPAKGVVYDYLCTFQGQEIRIAFKVSYIREPPFWRSKHKKDSADLEREVNTSFSRQAIREADTTISRIQYLDQAHLIKVNADDALIFQQRMTGAPYLDKYNSCKTLILHKDNIGDIQVSYFYNKGEEKIVLAEMERTYGMIYFQADHLFKPMLDARLLGKYAHLNKPVTAYIDTYGTNKPEARALFLAGLREAEFKQASKAVSYYLKAIAVDTNYCRAMNYAADALFKMNKIDSAKILIQRSILREPYLFEAHFLLARILELKNKPEEMAQVFKDFLQNNPMSYGANFELARLYLKSNRPEMALPLFQKCMTLYVFETDQKTFEAAATYYTGLSYYQIDLKTKSNLHQEEAKLYFLKAKDKGYLLPKEIEAVIGN